MSEQNKVEVYRRRARGERAGLGFLDNRVVDLSDSFEILEPEEPIDLRVYARILRKRLATLLIVFFLVFTVVLIATLKEKPVYSAQVLLEIQKENPDIPTIKDLYELESVSDSYLKPSTVFWPAKASRGRSSISFISTLFPNFTSRSGGSFEQGSSRLPSTILR